MKNKSVNGPKSISSTNDPNSISSAKGPNSTVGFEIHPNDYYKKENAGNTEKGI